jgi:BMFP domain-containing protein YqiC
MHSYGLQAALYCTTYVRIKTGCTMSVRADLPLDVSPANRYGYPMFDTKFIDDLARQISAAIPSGVKGMQEDVQKNIHTLLQGALSRLDLVTREEFDAQSQVLARTREKLEQMEKIVSGMEEKKNQ